MVDNEVISLSTNWNTLGDVDLRNILLENSSDKIEIDIEDMKTDNCVCLVNNSSEKSKAQLEINVGKFRRIKDIVLISEAQVIEVFGVNDEYLLTHTADFFDDWEEMAVYYSKISIPNVPVCKLKFTRARNDNRLWIYGAKVFTRKMANRPVALEEISRLIGSSNFANIKNGNHINNFLHYYFKNLPNNNLGYALGRKPGDSGPSNSCEQGSNDSPKIGENFLTEMLSKLQVQNSAESEKLWSKQPLGETCNNNWFIGYVDKKFHEIKEEILREVDAKFASLRDETNHKLDRIISLLENEKVKNVEY